jgi:hypothetical protein
VKLISFVLALLGISFLSFHLILHHSAATPGQTDTGQPSRAVVVELFTSEGCSSCPPADTLLAKLEQQQRLENAEIIALEEHVDYWDQLGWKDPFSSSQWTERQQDYAAGFASPGVYTPQMVVDGRTEFVGSSDHKARAAITDAAQQPKARVTLELAEPAPSLLRLDMSIKLLPETAGSEKAEVWLGVTESGLHSRVLDGENAGQDLHHASVVRRLRKAGMIRQNSEPSFSGSQQIRLDPGWKRENLHFVVFVQESKSRHILGAAQVRMER